MKKIFWSGLIFAIVGWVMYGIDHWINNPTTDVSTIGLVAGVLGLFFIVSSLID